jgi:5-methylcytosine-specific restriction endonuclease McrA
MMAQNPCKKCGCVERDGYGHCRGCQRLRDRRRRAADPEKARASNREYRARKKAENPMYDTLQGRKKFKKFPEYYRFKNRERWAWLKDGDVTKAQLTALYEASDGKCKYCGVDVRCRFMPSCPTGFDHVIPRSKGGRHTIENMVVCCGPCNLAKSDRILSDALTGKQV